MKSVLSRVVSVVVVSVVIVLSPLHVVSAARIKDIATIQGVRENQLIGYGLVVGLSGTGDKGEKTIFTNQSLLNMLKNMGMQSDPNDATATKLKLKNVAAVIVTAKLPTFAQPGRRIDVSVSSLGDATSLQGGTLLMTPLKGADRQVYAVAQGSVSVGGFIGGVTGSTIQKNHPTVGMISDGAIVEKAVGVPFAYKEAVTVSLREDDFTTAMRVSEAIDHKLGPESETVAVDARTVQFKVPDKYKGRLVDLMATIEGIPIDVDQHAKVVFNERTGTIVMGNHVTISDVAVSHGNVVIKVETETEISQPLPFSFGETEVVPKSKTTIEEERPNVIHLKGGTTIGDLVNALNDIGVSPRDLISILQTIKAAGALKAELEII